MYVNLKTKDIMPLICKLRIYKYQSSSKDEKFIWTQKEFSKGICSLKTYYSIEKGLSNPKEEIVNKFLKKIDAEFKYISELDDLLINYSHEILHNINFFRIKEAERYFLKMIKLLEPLNDFFYYRELLFIVRTAYNYYVHSKFMTASEYIYFINIYSVFNSDIDELGKDIAFKYLHTTIVSLDNYYEQVSQLKLENSRNILNQLNYFVFCTYFNNDKVLLKSFDKIEEELIKSKNYIRCVDLYTLYLNALMVFSYSAIEKEFESVLQKADTFLSKIKNDIKIAQFYLNIGLIYINFNMYEKASNYLVKGVELKTIYQKYSFILCYFSAQKSNTVANIDWNNIITFIDSDCFYSKKIEAAYNFFIQMIMQTKAKELQDFLINEVVRFINSDDKTFINIFKYELMLLTRQTRKYSDLHKFYTMIDKS